jgi:threonylcarbamoyladenosine tRNA methylthiotransferase MtaB
MGRHWYTASSYVAAVERIVRDTRVFGLGADIIAGFPGESEKDHRATLSLVESLPFTGLHVFPYSERPATAAERLGGRVQQREVSRRAAEHRELGARKAREYEVRRAGGRADVVMLGGVGADGMRRGLTEDYLAVNVSECEAPRGSRIAAMLESRDGTLFARPLKP